LDGLCRRHERCCSALGGRRTIVVVVVVVIAAAAVVAGAGAVPARTVWLGSVTVGTVHANRAVSQLLSQHGPELERRS